MKPILSICIGTFREAKNLRWTLASLLLDLAACPRLIPLVEIVVVDNEPQGPDGWINLKTCRNSGAKYVPMPEPVGTAPPRNRVVEEATGNWHMWLDSHCELGRGVLEKIVDWCVANPRDDDLHYGTLLSSAIIRPDGKPAIVWTHLKREFGGDGMFGKGAINPVAYDPNAKPFEVDQAGSWFYLARKESWLGFHPQFRGFGLEGYLATKYRRAGRKAWCHPAFQGWHLFREKSEPAPFPTDWFNRTRNLVLTWQELGEPFLSDIKSNLQRVDRDRWDELKAACGLDQKTGQPIAEPQALPADWTGWMQTAYETILTWRNTPKEKRGLLSSIHAQVCRATAAEWSQIVTELGIDEAAVFAREAQLVEATPPGKTAPPRPDQGLDCPNRREALRTETCDICGFRGQPVNVFACAKHGECTPFRFQEIKAGRPLMRDCAACIAYGDNLVQLAAPVIREAA